MSDTNDFVHVAGTTVERPGEHEVTVSVEDVINAARDRNPDIELLAFGLLDLEGLEWVSDEVLAIYELRRIPDDELPSIDEHLIACRQSWRKKRRSA